MFMIVWLLFIITFVFLATWTFAANELALKKNIDIINKHAESQNEMVRNGKYKEMSLADTIKEIEKSFDALPSYERVFLHVFTFGLVKL